MHPRLLTLVTGLLALVLLAVPAASQREQAPRPRPAAVQDNIELYFSPHGGAAQAIIHEINRARRSVLVASYYFASAPLARAILDAHQRGVQVTVLLDQSQESFEYSSARFFVNQGVPVFIVSDYATFHHKVMLIDGHTIVTGSMNFTRAGDERNAENTLIIRHKRLLYAAYEQKLLADLENARPANVS